MVKRAYVFLSGNIVALKRGLSYMTWFGHNDTKTENDILFPAGKLLIALSQVGLILLKTKYVV